jgi:hypothetical protein
MSKRTVFTTVTPLPSSITRETVLETLHSHTEMIDLNPLVEERHPIKPPPNASPEEYHCLWYSLTDRVQYLPGGIASGKVSYNACFHDLEMGLQTHCYAPMGLNIKGKWTLGGSLPGEPIAPVELGLGAPLTGLYLREDVDMKCNFMMTSFVKKTLKNAHAALVGRLLIKSQIEEATKSNQRISDKTLTPIPSSFSSQASTQYSPSEYADSPSTIEAPQLPPLQGLGFQGRESGFGNSNLYPQALNVRNSFSSHNGSIDDQGRRSSYQGSIQGNQNQRTSYQEPPQGQGAYEQRVSWQNLNNRSTSFSNRQSHQSPPLQHQQLHHSTPPQYQQHAQQFADQGYQNGNPDRVSAQSYHAELPSNEKQDLGRPEPEFRRPAGHNTPPPQHGHAELQG